MLSKFLLPSTLIVSGLSLSVCQPEGEQCGGTGYTGVSCCETGTACYAQDPSYSACKADQPEDWVRDPQKFDCTADKKCKVLIVVDMQNDYCAECKTDEDTCNWPYRSLLNDPAAKVNEAIRDSNVDYEFAVYTQGLQDWHTDDGDCTYPGQRGFEIMDTLKSGLDQGFANDPTKDFMTFSKLTDDWFTDAVFGSRQWANNGETLPFWTGDQPPTLPEQLKYRGFLPSNTQLFVTGTATNRCVMKGAVHARALGFDVILAKDAVTGGSEDRWVISKVTIPDGQNACAIPSETDEYGNLHHCAVSLSCEEYNNKQGGAPCTEEEKQEWMYNVYFGWRGGPSQNDAFKYLENSGVVVVDSVDEFKNPTSASCSNPQHAACNGLAGNCCPAADGTMLACCNQVASGQAPSFLQNDHLFAPRSSGGKGGRRGGKGGRPLQG